MPREVYTFTYKSLLHSYLPLAPFSKNVKQPITEIYDDEQFDLYNDKNEKVGYIWETGNQKTITNENKLYYILNCYPVIYFNAKNDIDVSYIAFNYFYRATYNGNVPVDDKFIIKAIPISKGGKYLNKNVNITYKQIGKTDKHEIILDY